MKKIFILLACTICYSTTLFAAEKSLMEEGFVVETSEDDMSESLDRLSGTIDKGFAPEGSTYRSPHHGRSGPFATHEDAYDVSTSY